MKKIIFTVTNDLVYDQRMLRICNTMAIAGYDVLLIGRKKRNSFPLIEQKFEQKRFTCWIEKGKWFYVEYNIRLLFILLFTKADCYCAIDVDSILPNLLVSKIKNKKRVYDAHELFCEMEEIVTRPFIYKIWKGIEKWCVPQFKNGYTIGFFYAQEFAKMYNVHYQIVRNATVLNTIETPEIKKEITYILYQGAVNEGRSFETLIPAMQYVNAKLLICGEGNFYSQAQALVKEMQLENKIHFQGYVQPAKLKEFSKNAYIGITLFTNTGKSNYLSLANRFFDYMHYAVPQICVNFPEYERINKEQNIAVCISEPSVEKIANALNDLLENKNLYQTLASNCLQARQQYCWQTQEKTLLEFYSQLFA